MTTRYELRCGDEEVIRPLSEVQLQAWILAGLVGPEDELRLDGGAAGRAIGQHPLFADAFERLALRRALCAVLSLPEASTDPSQRAILAALLGDPILPSAPSRGAAPPVEFHSAEVQVRPVPVGSAPGDVRSAPTGATAPDLAATSGGFSADVDVVLDDPSGPSSPATLSGGVSADVDVVLEPTPPGSITAPELTVPSGAFSADVDVVFDAPEADQDAASGGFSADVDVVLNHALDASWVDGESFATRDLLGFDPEAEAMTRYWAKISAEDYTGALAEFTKFTDRTRNNPEVAITATLARFMVSPQQEDRRVELQRAEDLVEANPDNIRARLVAAKMHASARHGPQAAQHLEHALTLEPDRTDLMTALAELVHPRS